MLNATGELEASQLSYISTRLGADVDAQEVVDSIRTESFKNHKTVDALQKCIPFLDADIMEQLTPKVLEISRTSISLGTKVACAHFISLVSNSIFYIINYKPCLFFCEIKW